MCHRRHFQFILQAPNNFRRNRLRPSFGRKTRPPTIKQRQTEGVDETLHDTGVWRAQMIRLLYARQFCIQRPVFQFGQIICCDELSPFLF